MPLAEMPKYKSVPDKRLDIPSPAIGGLNLDKLEYELPVTQSPYLKNLMYENGVLAKRYGLVRYNETDYTYRINALHKLNIDGIEEPIVSSGYHLYIGEEKFDLGIIETAKKMFFFNFDKNVYFTYYEETPTSSGRVDKVFKYKVIRQATEDEKTVLTNKIYKGYILADVDAYVPTILINCKPDGSYSDAYEDFNVVGNKAKIVYHADGTSTEYYFPLSAELKNQVIISNLSRYTTVEVDGEVMTSGWNFDGIENPRIVFTTAPTKGDSNVSITITIGEKEIFDGEIYRNPSMLEDKKRIGNSRSYALFGGTGASRVFLAGGGDAKLYWSDPYDCTYFPESNWSVLGNPEYDINAIGTMYNVLFALKDNEIYSISSYTQNSSNTLIEEDYGLEGFKFQLVNNQIGCDSARTLQTIDNRLTWFNKKYGVCTLASTNIIDERNVQVISKNVKGTNVFISKGITDFNEEPTSADYDSKYWLCFPSGTVFVWDYKISPYVSTSSKQTSPEQLSWFMFESMPIDSIVEINRKGVAIRTSANSVLYELDKSALHDDIFYTGSLRQKAIESVLMTPFLDFGMTDYLKTVKNIHIQVRGGRATTIDMRYYTDETSIDHWEEEHEPIIIGTSFWKNFQWTNFQWKRINWTNTFRRKCSLKKIQLASFYFSNNKIDTDMNISDIVLSYQIVKQVK